MTIVPFDPAHLALMVVQPAQRIAELEHPDALTCPFGEGWTVMVEGRPVTCAGLVETGPGVAYAWAVLSEDAGPHLLRVTREIRSRLATVPFRRVSMAVDAGFPQGLRWAAILGFQYERDGELPNGRRAQIFTRG